MPEPEIPSGHEFATVADIEPLALMEGLRVRPVNGERITLAVFELDPGMSMPEHLPSQRAGRARGARRVHIHDRR
jgi:hypothetical protein